MRSLSILAILLASSLLLACDPAITRAQPDVTASRVPSPSAPAGPLPYGYRCNYGDSTDDHLGYAANPVGDIDKDGYEDYIAGAYTAGNDHGYARVYSGASGAIIYQFDGDASNDQFGHSVAGAGDVNGDGVPDLIVGTRGEQNAGGYANYAKVFSGIDGAELKRLTGSNNFGYWVCGAGDLDGDGHAEVLVGAPGKDGKVMGYAELFHGNDLTSWVKWDGTDPNESNFGITVYGPGDLNLDGVPDLVICSWRSDLRGRVRVYSGDFIVNQTGKEILWQQDGVADDKMFICSGRGGDVNNDSYPDLAVGGYGANSGAGFVRVFSGLDGTLITELTEPGGAPGNFFGSSVALANVNGDSHADIIVGAYESLGRGLVWVFSGQSPYPVLSQFPGKPDEGFGARVEALETATPGVVWLLVGAPRAAGTRGMVCVVL